MVYSVWCRVYSVWCRGVDTQLTAIHHLIALSPIAHSRSAASYSAASYSQRFSARQPIIKPMMTQKAIVQPL